MPTLTSLLVKPVSADCNLACDYCFYRSKAALYAESPRHTMKEAVLETLIADFMGLSGRQVSSFGWQGGEPLLAGLDFFRKVVRFQQQYGRPGAVVGNGFQTNATLIDEAWARFFQEYRFLVGVSLDGPPEVHDHYRRFCGGQPSHGRVMEAIDLLRRYQVEFNVLVLLNPLNVVRPRELYEYFLERDLRYLQFIPCIEPDPVTGGAARFSITPEQYGAFLCETFDLWMSAGSQAPYIRMFDDLLAVYLGYEAPCCLFQQECGQYVVVEHNGDVYACDFFVEPDWFLGNLMETPLADIVASPKAREFRLRKRRLGADCQACPWQSLCYGGCPRHRTALQPEVARPSYFCESYQQFFAYSRPGFLKLKERIGRRQRRRMRSELFLPAQLPLQRSALGVPPSPPKPRRNDPCPCGSGLKFKRCCGR